MSSENAALTKRDQTIKDVAHELNAGHGDAGQLKLLKYTHELMAKDPAHLKAAKEFEKAKPFSKDWVDAGERDATAKMDINSKLWQDVIKAQGPDASKQLCKLEITKDGEDITGAWIRKTDTCHVTEYTIDHGKIVPIKDK
jgi:hypothetical protein